MYLSSSFKGLNNWWRYLIGIALIFMAYFSGQLILYFVVLSKAPNSNAAYLALQKFEETMDFSVIYLDKNVGFILLILMFLCAVIMLYFVTKYLHQKEFKHLITPFAQINIKKILLGFLIWFALSFVLECINYMIDPSNYTFRWNPEGFIPLLIISFTLLPIQTSFEELFFRGYLMQAFAFFTRSKWAALLISSVFFGLVHSTNPEVAEYGFWTMQIYYILAGLFLGFITLMDDGLELALGVHAATNIFGATFFTYEGSVIQTDCLFISHHIVPWQMILAFLIAAAVFSFMVGKIYHWRGLSYLNESITRVV
jgi:membrane protease YdiL (CAAX protease family)